MNIATAQREISAIKKKLADRDQRIKESTLYKEGEEPAFPLEDLRAERNELIKQLISLESRRDIANCSVKLPDGRLLLYGVREIQQMKGTIALMDKLPHRAKETFTQTDTERDYDDRGRSVRTVVETKMVCKYTSRARAQELDALQEKFSKLNSQVEALNHSTNLPEQ